VKVKYEFDEGTVDNVGIEAKSVVGT